MSKKYTQEHEWIEADGSNYAIGITNYAQEQLGDVVMVDMPEVGRDLTAGEECAVIESVKAASDIYSPIDGQVTEVNEALADNPALVNDDPEGEGWLWKMSGSGDIDMDSLMDAAAYEKFIEDSE